MIGIQLQRIGQIARTVGDISASEAWFRDVLELKHLFTFGKLAFFDCGGTRLMLSEVEAPTPDESLIYFECEGIKGSAEILTTRGVEFIQTAELVHKHEDGTEEWMAFFKDPDGRPLALMSRVPPVAEPSKA
jgi:methylmalonyl-CoA/ethylmalonyl-CoA epimerase